LKIENELFISNYPLWLPLTQGEKPLGYPEDGE